MEKILPVPDFEPDCSICQRIKNIKSGKNPNFIAELKTCYLVLGDHQLFEGYSLLLCKKHVKEIFNLEGEIRKMFLWEISVCAQAIYNGFHPRKINYEILGNLDPHLHCHIFPRYDNDREPYKPVWAQIEKYTLTAGNEKSMNRSDNLNANHNRKSIILDNLKKIGVEIISGF